MRKFGMAALALCAMTTMGVAAAYADDANPATCVATQSKVDAALASNASSANHDAAAKERRYGLQFCNNSRYQAGLDHYNQALKLLGAS